MRRVPVLRASAFLPSLMLALAAAAVFLPLTAAAQEGLPSVSGALRDGDCIVALTLATAGATGAQVELVVNGMRTAPQTAEKLTRVTVELGFPLKEGDRVRVRYAPKPEDVKTGDPVVVQPRMGTAKCGGGGGDERDALEASGYLGTVFDNFAPAVVGGYAPNQSGGMASRYIGGVDFEFRIIGSPKDTRQLWLFGETLHGVRSADVDCSAKNESKPAVCGDLTSKSPEKMKYIMQHATSLEAFVGLRLELFDVQRYSESPSKFYVTAQYGLMALSGNIDTVAGAPGVKASRAYGADHVGLGLAAVGGPLEGSYAEIGMGKTDLFHDADSGSKWNRLKVDGHLSFPFDIKVPFVGWKLSSGPRVFVEFFGDIDPSHREADSLQSFVGLDFNVHDLFKW